jgi:hypothetical protein
MADPCAVFPAGRPSEAIRLSTEALEILDRFSRPRKVRAVLQDANEEMLAALDEWVARGLLVATRRAIPRSKWTPLEARLWARSASAIEARVAKLSPTRREAVGGRRLIVLDGAFTRHEVAAASRWVHRLPFVNIQRDVPSQTYARDVYDLLARVPIVDCITAVVRRALPYKRLESYWAFCNRARYGDVAVVHRDAASPSLFTALYFANARWERDWGGETLYYGLPGEPTAVVAPRPGRLVVFDGRIVHRAGVPTRLCDKPRLTVTVRYRVR